MNGILMHRRSLLGSRLINTPINTQVPLAGLYWHSDDTSFTLDGSNITAWNNKVNTSQSITPIHNICQAVDSPDFKNNKVANVINNAYFSGFDVSSLNTGEGVTYIQVIRNPVSVGGDMMLWFWQTGQGPYDLWTTNQSNECLFYNTFNSTQFGNYTPKATKDRNQVRIVTSVMYNNNVPLNRLYEDGELLEMNVSNMPSSYQHNGTFYPIAYVPPSSNYNFRGEVAEFLFYNRILTESELQDVHNLLLNKYTGAIITPQQPPLILNEQDSRISYVGNWTLETHPAYDEQSGRYIQGSNRDGFLQIEVPIGYTKARFEGIVGQPGSTSYGEYDYLVNNTIIGSGTFTRDIPSQFGKGVYFDIVVKAGDIIRQVFYGGTGFCDTIIFYN